MSAPLEPTPRGKRVGLGQVFRGGLRALGPDRKRLAFASGLAFLTGLLETLMLYIIARVAVALTSGDHTLELGPGPLHHTRVSVGRASLLAGVLLVVLSVIAVPSARILASLSARVIVRMRSQLIEAYMSSSWAYRSTHREGYLQQLVGEYSQRGEDAIQQLSTVVVSLCTVSVVCLGAAIASPLPSVGAAVGLLLVALVVRPLSRRVKLNSMNNARINRDVVGRVAQTTRLSEEIAAYGVGEVVSEDLHTDVVDASHALERVRTTTRLVPTLYQYGALGVVLLLIGILSVSKPDGLVEIAPLVLLMIRALTYLRQLLQASQSGNELYPYLEAIDDELAELRAHPVRPGSVALERFDGLSFEGVSFEYIPDHPVLIDVDFTVQQGEVLGIAGPSGGGKTTLTQLVLRLRQPTSGRIEIGEVDLREVEPHAWSAMTAFVPQDNKLIYATVADNIRFYRADYADDAVIAAATAAHLHDEIVALPQGYETMVGPGARDLSGGQCQRLGIARALLGQPQLLVLDEPTSALDPRSESLIRRTLNELSGTVTIILVAHRNATLEVCDRVLRVSKGHVHEETDRISPAV